jgi:hypothetical protein
MSSAAQQTSHHRLADAEVDELLALLENTPSVEIGVGGRQSRAVFFAETRGAVHVKSTSDCHTVTLARGNQ